MTPELTLSTQHLQHSVSSACCKPCVAEMSFLQPATGQALGERL